MIEADASSREARAGTAASVPVRDIVALAMAALGLLLCLALFTEGGEGNWAGRVGSELHTLLTFVFGRYVSAIVPLLVLMWAMLIWRGRGVSDPSLRVAGMFLLTVCACGFLSVPYARLDLTKVDGFRVGGAVGNFLMHQQCLNLRGYAGQAGSYLLMVAGVLIAVILLTGLPLRTVIAGVAYGLTRLDPRRWTWPAWADFTEVDEKESVEASVAAAPVRTARKIVTNDPVPAARSSALFGAGLRRSDASRVRADGPAAGTDAGDIGTSLRVAVLDAMEKQERTERSRRRARPAKRTPSRNSDPDDLFDPRAGDDDEDDDLPFKTYLLPELDLLNTPRASASRMSHDEIHQVSDTLEQTLANYGVTAQVDQVTQGPTVTRFELQLAPGVKVARIANLEKEIAMGLEAEAVRIIAPIPGKNAVGIEVPNRQREIVYLSELLASEILQNHPSPLAFALGKTISGEHYICDLAAMPHLLIAGSTGQGKSVCMNSILMSLLYRMKPDQVRLILIDPKRVEFSIYHDIPHLLSPVVCDPKKAAAALTWAVEEMEDRYKRLQPLGVRNIDGYNAIVKSTKPHPKAEGRRLEFMPHIVIVIDELGDLMTVARNEVEDSIMRLAQMARAVGMHLILATQRPAVSVITGNIKANFPSRIAMKTMSQIDSRTILDSKGAESLLGRGDLLILQSASPRPVRVQGCYISDAEVEAVADHVRAQQKVEYVKDDFVPKEVHGDYELRLDGIDADESGIAMDIDDDDSNPYSARQGRLDGRPVGGGSRAAAAAVETDDDLDRELFHQAVRVVLTYRKASTSLLQRRLKVGFARAGRLMDLLEEAGIVGPNVGSKVREILVDPQEYLQKYDDEEGRF